jgi:hypothetical protein
VPFSNRRNDLHGPPREGFLRFGMILADIHELQQILWLDTPKGLALAKFIIIEGIDSDILWIAAIQKTGECWTFSNEDIRFCKNVTIGRRCEWEKTEESSNAPRKPE